MNRREIENAWDECRDGDLSGDDRKAFDERMLNDPDLAALWGAESRWLGTIKESESRPDDGDATDVAFRHRVLTSWDKDRQRRAMVHLFWRRALLVAGCAAAAAVAVLISWTREPGRSNEPVMANSHPVTVLVSDMSEQAWTQPEELYNAVRGTSELLTIEQAIRMFQPPSERQERQRR